MPPLLAFYFLAFLREKKKAEVGGAGEAGEDN